MGARQKAIGKEAERRIAKQLGAVRFPADAGGPLDAESDWLGIQVKSSERYPSDAILDALDTARNAVPDGKLGVAAFERRYGSGRPRRAVVVIDIEDWDLWFGGAPPVKE